MKKFLSGLVTSSIILTSVILPVTTCNVSAESQTLFINEIMAVNNATIRDSDVDDAKNGALGGSYSDWIEIYNSSSKSVDLTGYTISDDTATWTIPQGTIPAKGYILIWASDKDKVAADGQLHTNFKLSSTGETVTFKKADGTIIDTVTFTTLTDNQSYSRISDGATEFSIVDVSTPRNANVSLAPTNTPLPTSTPTPFVSQGQTVFINEIMAVNNATLRDGDVDDAKNGALGGSYSDWIEIYNSDNKSIALTGYKISDDTGTWTIPECYIPAKGHLLIWASDKDKVATDGQFHANFKLSSTGETIVLKKPDGTLVDSLPYPVLSDNQSYGRISDGGDKFKIFDTSTPRTSNSPLNILVGDINQDKAVNMLDVMIIAKAFNSAIGEEGYNSAADLNTDGSINMQDVMIIAKNFNMTLD